MLRRNENETEGVVFQNSQLLLTGIRVQCPSTQKGKNNISRGKDISKHNNVTTANVSRVAKAMGDGIQFCSDCIIIVQSCNVGVEEKMSNELAAGTGCTIKAAKGFCWSNLRNPDKAIVKADYLGYTYPGAETGAWRITPPPSN